MSKDPKDLSLLTFRMYTYKDLLDFYEANYKKSRAKDDKGQVVKPQQLPHNYTYRELLDFYLTYYLLKDSNGLTIESLEEKIEALRREVAEGKAREDDLKERLIKSGKENQQLNLDKANLQDSLNDSHKNTQQLSHGKANVQSSLNLLKAMYDDTLRERHQLAEDKANLEDALDNSCKESQQLAQEKASLLDNYKTCLIENKQLNEEKAYVLTNLNQELERHKEELAETHEQYRTAHSENKRLTEVLQTTELQKKSQRLEDDIRQQEGRLKETLVKLNMQKFKADNVTERLGFISSKLNVSEQELEKQKFEVRKLTSHIRHINSDLEKCMLVIDKPMKLRAKILDMKASYPESYQRVQLDDQTKEAYLAEICKLQQKLECSERIQQHTTREKERLQRKVHILLKRSSNSMETTEQNDLASEYDDTIMSSVQTSMDDTLSSEHMPPDDDDDDDDDDDPALQERPSVLIGPMDKYVKRV
ncbi:hypothetical protein JOB18_030895 [Solea senegalensis]|uniref:LisH domain-containing protein n=1 Tax=Solea senegalensis TaxID=28829 RepID=A0AAV6Q4H3_SOLSE|nr:hypothetical protein JOB18_030895 [Solea senegalensis]